MRRPRSHVTAGIALLLAISMSFGQAPAGPGLRGTVKDAQGKPLAGVIVNALGSGDKNVKTDQSGRFILPLSSGQHIVLAQHPGFQTAAGVFRFASTETIDHEFTLTPNPDCPSGAAANPPTETLRASDFVEVEFPDQLLAGHRIRIRADGEVTWRGAALGGGISYHDIANVPAEDASALIEKYRSNGFWSLCADYAPYFLTIDAYLGYTTLQINGQIRRVADHEMAAPSLLHDLQRDFETVANAERWRRSLRHPAEWLLRVGPLSFQQARTQANARGNLNALDSGGWTTLMYATQLFWPRDSMNAIISAGANPNARSRTNDTVLILAVTATSRQNPEWIQTLIAAGANVNAQDREGRTALINTVIRFPLPGGGAAIAKILRTAGARTNIRDTYGMTALDYFEQNRKRASTYQQSAYEELWQILTAP